MPSVGASRSHEMFVAMAPEYPLISAVFMIISLNPVPKPDPKKVTETGGGPASTRGKIDPKTVGATFSTPFGVREPDKVNS
jgi:hypothetical protein